MIRNYIKIAWRNLQRNKLYGFINIGGQPLKDLLQESMLLYQLREKNHSF